MSFSPWRGCFFGPGFRVNRPILHPCCWRRACHRRELSVCESTLSTLLTCSMVKPDCWRKEWAVSGSLVVQIIHHALLRDKTKPLACISCCLSWHDMVPYNQSYPEAWKTSRAKINVALKIRISPPTFNRVNLNNGMGTVDNARTFVDSPNPNQETKRLGGLSQVTSFAAQFDGPIFSVSGKFW